MYHLDITKKQISDVFKISDVTISKTYRRIHPFHNIVMNNVITDLVLQKKNVLPKKKIEITQENLIVQKKKVVKKKKKKQKKQYLSDSDESDIEV